MPCPVRTCVTACVTEWLHRAFGVRTRGALRDRNSRSTALEPHSTVVRPLILAQIALHFAKSLLHRYLPPTTLPPASSTFLATPHRREPQWGSRGAPREHPDEAPGQPARSCTADGASRVRIGPTAGSTAGGSSPPPRRCPPDQRVAPPRVERRLRRRPGQHPRGPGLSGRESRGGTPAGGAGTIARRFGHV